MLMLVNIRIKSRDKHILMFCKLSIFTDFYFKRKLVSTWSCLFYVSPVVGRNGVLRKQIGNSTEGKQRILKSLTSNLLLSSFLE